MGGWPGQCDECCGLRPHDSWRWWYPLSDYPQIGPQRNSWSDLGHKRGCVIAAALADLGEEVVLVGDLDPSVVGIVPKRLTA